MAKLPDDNSKLNKDRVVLIVGIVVDLISCSDKQMLNLMPGLIVN